MAKKCPLIDGKCTEEDCEFWYISGKWAGCVFHNIASNLETMSGDIRDFVNEH